MPGLAGCQGCNTELIMRHALRRIGPDTVLATPPGCIPGMGSVGYNGLTGTKVPVFHPLLTNTASMLAGVKRRYKRLGREVNAVALAGDGGASDVGFQSLSGAAERGEQILFICVDNEGYMNTGMQRSSCTPYGAWTSTTPVGERGHGKTQDAKNLPLLMMMHNCEYVATASTAFMEDLYAKLDRAIAASQARLRLPAHLLALHHRLALPVAGEHRGGAQGGRDQLRACCGSSIRATACALTRPIDDAAADRRLPRSPGQVPPPRRRSRSPTSRRGSSGRRRSSPAWRRAVRRRRGSP